jgi:hypothetical protein
MRDTQKNSDYVSRVLSGEYPLDRTVPIDDEFVDGRGVIKNLIFGTVASVARIQSIKGSLRANHYHLTDWHFTFIEKGRIAYFERKLSSTEIPEPTLYDASQMFFTPPLVEHAMLFIEDTVIFTFSRNIRQHDLHESDVRRVSFVTNDLASKYISIYSAKV